MLHFFERRPALDGLQPRISELKAPAESISRQIRGQRHLTANSKANYQKQQEQKASHERWIAMQREACAKLPKDAPARIHFESKHGPIE